MLEELKKKVYEANMELPRKNLVVCTWGNVSGIDREKNLMVIKPSGVEYEDLTPEMMVAGDMDGNVGEGGLNPSSDTRTPLEQGYSQLWHPPRRLRLRPHPLCPASDSGGAG